MENHAEQFEGIHISRSVNHSFGKFGRLFPALPRHVAPTEDLVALAENMLRSKDTRDGIPAGYTYLGQFMTHDLTFDATTLTERATDIDYIWNFRTPALNLDSMYGSGPAQCPHLFTLDKNGDRTLFLINKLVESKLIEPQQPKMFYDLPRVSIMQANDAEEAFEDRKNLYSKNRKVEAEHLALVVDPRHDSHLLISQLLTAFLLFHNKIVKKLINDPKLMKKHSKIKELGHTRGDSVFEVARRIVTWHYQYLILNDYLPKIINQALFAPDFLKNLIANKKARQYFNWRNEPFIPVEFSVAAFRLGHSQVLDSYILNTRLKNTGAESSVMGHLFSSEGKDINLRHQKKPDSFVEWRHFFFSDTEKGNANNKISPHITLPLKKLPFVSEKTPNMPNLAFRNLARSISLELPSGENVAKTMSLTEGYQKEVQEHIELLKQIDRYSSLRGNTPLWYYILAEAEAKGDGKLGILGGTIVAEVIIGLIHGDKNSYLNQNPQWTPQEEEKLLDYEGGILTMIDFMKFAGVYSYE
ncbi:MAG: hypothetical protein JNL70_25915 [Saprospiraceae bacterium]|nr:hypothetical protein [Saprospiraceae bacterium]